MTVFDEPKIDCHTHILDGAAFPFADTFYTPSGGELSTVGQLINLFDSYGVSFGLLVNPNVGYDLDNACLFDALQRAQGRLKGIVLVPNDTSLDQLIEFRALGVIGVSINTVILGTDYYADVEPLLGRLASLDMFANVQVQGDDLIGLTPMLRRSGVRVLIDHCGRPVPEAGLGQPSFQALLALAKTDRVTVKLSGQVKFSGQAHPYPVTWPYIEALLDTFGPRGCVWASDWPFLRSPHRMDYGPLLTLLEQLVPDPADRHAVLWDTPARLLGVG